MTRYARKIIRRESFSRFVRREVSGHPTSIVLSGESEEFVSKAEVVMNLIIALVAGVVAAGVWTCIERSRRRRKNAEHFAWMEGLYGITRKLAQESQPWKASVKVDDSVLKVEYEDLPEGDSVIGEIAMNELFSLSGSGVYSHVKAGQQLGGSWELQVLNRNTLLVHTAYAHYERFEQVTEAEVWERISPADAS